MIHNPQNIFNNQYPIIVMDSGASIRRYRGGDEENIVELLRIAFNGWPQFDLECTPLDHWKWKFRSQEEKAWTTIAESNNKIVGCNHKFYLKAKIGDQIIQASQAVDSAVHPDYRGSGVYSRMRTYQTEKDRETPQPEHMMYWASNNPIIVKKEDKMGCNNFPHPLIRLVRITDIDSHPFKNGTAKMLFIKCGYNALKMLNKLQGVPRKTRAESPRLKIEDVAEFDERYESFWNQIKNHYAFITERSRGYLEWRYCDPRGGKYTVKQAVEDDEIIGYVVLRVNRYIADYPTGYIVDLCTLRDRPDCVDSLIAESLRSFDAMGVNCVNYCTIKGHPHQKHMEKFGFLDTRSNLYISYKPYRDATELDEFKNAPPGKILFQYNDIDWI
jgi:hypothetical protein